MLRRKIRGMVLVGAACSECGIAADVYANPRLGALSQLCAPCFDAADLRGTVALKCWPQFFQEVVDGKKRFEFRQDERRFRVGELLMLQEWKPQCLGGIPDPKEGYYTGREYKVRVTYKLTEGMFASGLPRGSCILSITPAFEELEADTLETAVELERTAVEAVIAWDEKLRREAEWAIRRASEYRVNGENATVRVSWRTEPAGETEYSLSVRRGDGTLETRAGGVRE
jgi:hypothetical protein